MPNMTITNVKTGSVVLGNGQFSDFTLKVGASETAPEGLVLARVGANLVPYDPAADATGAEIPRYVLTYAVETPASGEKRIRAMQSGEVIAERLVVGVAGVPGADVTDALIDGLKDNSIIVQSANQLAALDNQ